MQEEKPSEEESKDEIITQIIVKKFCEELSGIKKEKCVDFYGHESEKGREKASQEDNTA